jgi:hypothetical protein
LVGKPPCAESIHLGPIARSIFTSRVDPLDLLSPNHLCAVSLPTSIAAIDLYPAPTPIQIELIDLPIAIIAMSSVTPITNQLNNVGNCNSNNCCDKIALLEAKIAVIEAKAQIAKNTADGAVNKSVEAIAQAVLAPPTR